MVFRPSQWYLQTPLKTKGCPLSPSCFIYSLEISIQITLSMLDITLYVSDFIVLHSFFCFQNKLNKCSWYSTRFPLQRFFQKIAVAVTIEKSLLTLPVNWPVFKKDPHRWSENLMSY